MKKEIENLESIQEISPEAKHFVDTKADKVISLLNEAIKSQEQIKAEAIKEFAERLRNKFFNYYDGLTENTSKSNHNGDSLMFYEVADMIVDCIDNLVKEMTEGENGNV